MVKKIFFVGLILILLMQIGYAENSTLIDSYSYDYIANGTTVRMLDQMDTDEKTAITFELNTTPGNIEVSSVLGIISSEQTFFSEGNQIVTVEFNKVLPGEKELLIMVYNGDSLVAFITNYHVIVDNNVELAATPESLVTIDDILYVALNIQTNMEITDSSAKIISTEGKVYDSTGASIENNKVTYAFAPLEASEYNLYELSVNGYMMEFNHSLGKFDFSKIKSFKEIRTDAGLEISFTSDCPSCEKDITLLSTEDEYVYNEKITSDSLTIASDIMYAMEINGPYKVIINYAGTDFEFMTQAYNYGDFMPTAVDTTKTTTGSGSEGTAPTQGETTEVTEEPITEEITEETAPEQATEETSNEEVQETAAAEKKEGNLLTGLSISNIEGFASKNKAMLLGGLAVIIVVAILVFMYIRQRRDAYLYEM